MPEMNRVKIKYKESFRFYLVEDYQIKIDGLPEETVPETYKMVLAKGNLMILRGYMWDGFTKNKKLMRGFLVHTALCQLIRLGYLPYSWRLRANAVLFDILTADGVPKIVAWCFKRLLDVLGRISSKGGKRVRVAP